MADSLITGAVRALIGSETPPERNRFPISAEMVAELADAVEDANPLYTDQAAAEGSRFHGLLCPPLATWKDFTPPIGYFGAGQESHFEVPLPFNGYGLNGGSDWQFLRPAYIGDWITRRFKILDIYQKAGRSGPLVFVQRQETQTNQHGHIISIARRLSIHRGLDQAVGDAQPAGPPDGGALRPVEVSPPAAAVSVPRPQPSAQPQLYLEDVSAGMPLPPLVKGPLTTTHLVRWAAANGNYARIHWDLPFAQRHQGLANVVVNGSLKNQYLGQLLVDFAGAEGWLRRFYVEHRGMDYPGDLITAAGEVTAVRPDAGGAYGYLDCAIRLTNSRGQQTAEGRATIALPCRGQQLPLVWPGE